MKKVVLKIGGMTCSACSSGLEKYLNKQNGIIQADVNLVLSVATIEYEGISKKQIAAFVREAGFTSLGEFKSITDLDSDNNDKIKIIVFGFLALLLMYISMGHMLNLPSVPLINHDHPVIISTVMFIFSLIFIAYGYDILKSGIKNLLHKMPNMDTLVTFSVTFSFLYSLYGYINVLLGNFEYLSNLYFESVCMVIYFIKLGRFIENIGKDKTKDAIKKLVQITPQKAILKINNKEKTVSIDEVQKDDILICKAGDKIAVDGVVVSGKTYVDESFITGESMPSLKEAGSPVLAGSINYNGYIEYKAQKIGKETTISEVVKLVVEATNNKAKIQQLADKISGYFVQVVVLIAVITFIIQLGIGLSFNEALIHMITVFVVACPCALGLAVPLVSVISSGKCAQKGLFLRNGSILEKTKNIDTIVLDKTGTLTFGKLKIFKVYNYSNYSDKKLLNIVANIEKKSSHPISTAFKISKKLKVTNFKTLNGLGIYGEIDSNNYYLGNNKLINNLKINDSYQKEYNNLINDGCTIIYVTENNEIIGLLGVKDVVRDNTKNIIQSFLKKNIEVIMLTGDNEQTANIIAEELGIKKVVANVLPQNKASYIKKLIDKNKKVIMVGDGINDAPALATATIGISINDGTDVAMDSADVILTNNNLENILDLINISKKSYKIIWENLILAFIYNVCMIPIAMGLIKGINITPVFGSVAMVLSSLTVILNSLRFGRWKNEKSDFENRRNEM